MTKQGFFATILATILHTLNYSMMTWCHQSDSKMKRSGLRESIKKKTELYLQVPIKDATYMLDYVEIARVLNSRSDLVAHEQ